MLQLPSVRSSASHLFMSGLWRWRSRTHFGVVQLVFALQYPSLQCLGAPGIRRGGHVSCFGLGGFWNSSVSSRIGHNWENTAWHASYVSWTIIRKKCRISILYFPGVNMWFGIPLSVNICLEIGRSGSDFRRCQLLSLRHHVQICRVSAGLLSSGYRGLIWSKTDGASDWPSSVEVKNARTFVWTAQFILAWCLFTRKTFTFTVYIRILQLDIFYIRYKFCLKQCCLRDVRPIHSTRNGQWNLPLPVFIIIQILFQRYFRISERNLAGKVSGLEKCPSWYPNISDDSLRGSLIERSEACLYYSKVKCQFFIFIERKYFCPDAIVKKEVF
jgi:hypothetical protein